MTNFKKPHFMNFGPAMPIVGIRQFSLIPAADDMLTGAWSVVGPSAARNMQRDHRGRCLELWQVIAAAYLEGLHHGSAMQREMQEANDGI